MKISNDQNGFYIKEIYVCKSMPSLIKCMFVKIACSVGNTVVRSSFFLREILVRSQSINK